MEGSYYVGCSIKGAPHTPYNSFHLWASGLTMLGFTLKECPELISCVKYCTDVTFDETFHCNKLFSVCFTKKMYLPSLSYDTEPPKHTANRCLSLGHTHTHTQKAKKCFGSARCHFLQAYGSWEITHLAKVFVNCLTHAAAYRRVCMRTPSFVTTWGRMHEERITLKPNSP